MDISLATFWWVLAGAAVAVELAQAPSICSMLALGFAAGAIAAHSSACRWPGGSHRGRDRGRRRDRAVALATLAPAGAAPAAQEIGDVDLTSPIACRSPRWAPDGTARVQHRGSVWSARLAPGATARPGEHVTGAVEGNWLVLMPSDRQ